MTRQQGGKPSLLVTRRLPGAVEARLASVFDVTLNRDDTAMSPAALAAAMTRHDALCPTITDRIDARLLHMPGRTVRVIANFGAGTEHIDLDAARAAGIVVTNTPDALTDSTADLAMLLILMAMRRAGEGERALRRGDWGGWRPTHMLGQALAGKMLGLIGFGRIAQAVAVRARGFGMQVSYYNRSGKVARAGPADDARHMPSLAALAEQADVLSLHVPGGAGTRHLVDAPLLARMKPGAVLINTARGSVVDEAALAEALRSGRLGSAGLDVYEREPAVSAALLALENVVLLPHLGSATLETRTAMGMQAATNLEAFFAGVEPPHRLC
ncbi:D-glycerate dehydrogenase [Sphingomonas sp. AR_OL41]|uniref:2-hydroxyacid dehydrogenase n=1 Tax=Sphingomonas sp. AR_OL41 TaxID=3042729 RepID=UPI002480036E|nr:D-glycerate dehydrogenase [Sphingomonas sp. AR_OL41]MDH7973913.1 D-glycerate dehydrogenase [Sphingomonas sp. AR_OL41]